MHYKSIASLSILSSVALYSCTEKAKSSESEASSTETTPEKVTPKPAPPVPTPEVQSSWFAQDATLSPKVTQHVLKNDEISDIREKCFAAYKTANSGSSDLFTKSHLGNGEKLKPAKFKIDDKHTMPYAAFTRGEMPEGGWPLVIAMHGGGKCPQKIDNPHGWSINTREWQTQASLSAMRYPDNSLYFVPRMVDDNNGRWWRDFNVTAYEKLIKHAIIHWDVNPNKVYMLGISEGGYGTEVLASWIPDKLAAANGMACGSSTSVPVENLRNVPFRTDVGQHDTAFKRIANAKQRHVEIEKLRAKDPKGYTNSIGVQKGRGHGIDYVPGPKWIMQHTRNPHPQRVVYTGQRLDGGMRHGAYWLQCINDLGKRDTFLDGSIKNNTITISAKATKKDGKYQNPEWGAKRADQGKPVPATGLTLRIWLHEKQIDFSKPLTVIINGKSQTVTPKATLGAMVESISKFGDPNYAYAGFVDVTVK